MEEMVGLGFEDLGNRVFLSHPWDKDDPLAHNFISCQPSSSPTIIVLCTWIGGATTQRIAKYTDQYQELFPRSYVLVLRTEILDFSFRTQKVIQRNLKPARDAILRLLAEGDPTGAGEDVERDGGILLHIFSQGGCNIALQLILSLRMTTREQNLPLWMVVFDSCPGNPDAQQTFEAGTFNMPTTEPMRTVSHISLYAMVTILFGLQSMKLAISASDMRAQFNNPSLFGLRTRRLYLCSVADQTVDVNDVQKHRLEALIKGYRAEALFFDKAPHCALVMEDATSYWQAIVDCWVGKRVSGFRKAGRSENDVPRSKRAPRQSRL